jgi:hypothetical protein
VTVPERQNAPDARVSSRAFSRRYRAAKRWLSLRFGVSILVGTVGVALVWLVPETGYWVSAFAAAWIVASQLILRPTEKAAQLEGARAQEDFDVRVLGLPWNKKIAGTRPSPEVLLEWGQKGEDLVDWYPDVSGARAPVDCLICQRGSLMWAHRDHRKYANGLAALGASIVALSLLVGVLRELTLGDYLLYLGVPLMPAILDVFRASTQHRETSVHRGMLHERSERLLERSIEECELPEVEECREIQNDLFEARCRPGVPTWLYERSWIVRQEGLDEATARIIDRLPPELKDNSTDT